MVRWLEKKVVDHPPEVSSRWKHGRRSPDAAAASPRASTHGEARARSQLPHTFRRSPADSQSLAERAASPRPRQSVRKSSLLSPCDEIVRDEDPSGCEAHALLGL